MYYVYAHYRKTDNSIFYVGVAKSLKRFTSKYSRNKYWKNIVDKNNYYYKILFESNKWEDCLNKEIELISYYGRLDLNTGVLCNMTNGGEGCVNLSNESKQKISNKLKGIKHNEDFKNKAKKRQTGVKLSEETKRRMSISHKKVDKSYLFGLKKSAETRLKLSISKKGKSTKLKGIPLTEKHKLAISNGFKEIFNNKQISEMLLMHSNGISFRNIAKEFNSNHVTISKYIQKYENL